MRCFSTCMSLAVIAALLVGVLGTSVRAEYPKPSPYPITWEFTFKHSKPERITVETEQGRKAYWYLTYTVINETDQERVYLPIFQMLTNDGRVIRSDQNIPFAVFEAIKKREKNQFLEPFTQIGGEILLGEEQARDGVAIWEEPGREMGQFSIFVTGLSGESETLKDSKGALVKDAEGNPVILRKTLQLKYFVRGDDVLPGEDEVNEDAEDWVMR